MSPFDVSDGSILLSNKQCLMLHALLCRSFPFFPSSAASSAAEQRESVCSAGRIVREWRKDEADGMRESGTTALKGMMTQGLRVHRQMIQRSESHVTRNKRTGILLPIRASGGTASLMMNRLFVVFCFWRRDDFRESKHFLSFSSNCFPDERKTQSPV